MAAIQYESTRGHAPILSFADAMVSGLATDGGLYLPQVWPQLDPSLLTANLSYSELAIEVMWPFVEGSIERDDFARLVTDSYATFVDDQVIPLVELEDDIHLVELFHGPTLAFKDVAMQLLGRLLNHELQIRDQSVTIVGATSGDTGSAAIEACRDRDTIEIVILHPAGRVSDVQRKQMTTVTSENVHNVALDGTFDDCQDLVKAMFADTEFRTTFNLSAVNSINWARVMAQMVYYVWVSAQLGGPVTYAVPTGNFGNVFAGDSARRMGLEVNGFIVASNRNDILTRFFDTGSLDAAEVQPSLSPSMDIQVSSNLERLLYELHDRDGDAVSALLASFRAEGSAALDPQVFAKLGDLWRGERVDDEQTLAIIEATYRRHGRLIDPHTAVALGAAQRLRAETDGPIAVLSTAHPAKFPDAVEQATGVRPELPTRLGDLFAREEKCSNVANDLHEVEQHIGSVVRR